VRGAYLPGNSTVDLLEVPEPGPGRGQEHVADARLLQDLAAWELHPEVTVTDRSPLAEVAGAYRYADAPTGGKVAVVMD
jgi:hypothetical protein